MDILRIKWVSAECKNTVDVEYIIPFISTLRWLIWDNNTYYTGFSWELDEFLCGWSSLPCTTGWIWLWFSLAGNINSFSKLSCRIYTSPVAFYLNAFFICFAMNRFYFYNLTQIILNVTLRGGKIIVPGRFGHKREVEELAQEIQQCFTLFNVSSFLSSLPQVCFPSCTCRLPDSKNTLMGSILGKFIKVNLLLLSKWCLQGEVSGAWLMLLPDSRSVLMDLKQ